MNTSDRENKVPLIILGAGGFAREAASWLGNSQYYPASFLSDDPSQSQCAGRPVVHEFTPEWHCEFLCAIGDPKARERMVERAYAVGMIPCLPIFGAGTVWGDSVTLSRGTIICPGVIVTADVRIGKHVILNLHATVGHDSVLEDFVTVSPGANISGNCHVGRGAYIGTNSCLREGVKIGARATVGAGAVVLRDVPEGAIVVGNPAKPMPLRPV